MMFRAMARDVVVKASQDGTLADALQAADEDEQGREGQSLPNCRRIADELQEDLKDSLQRAFESGELEAGLKIRASKAQEQGPVEQPPRIVVTSPPPPSSPPPPLPPPDQTTERVDEIENVRQTLRSSLIKSCRSGKLATTLESLLPPAEPLSIKVEPLSSTELEQAKRDASEALKAVCRSVNVTKLLDTPEPSFEEMKSKVKTLLTKCHETGTLENALKKVTSRNADADPQSPQLEAFKGDVRNKLTDAHNRGVLQKTLETAIRDEGGSGERGRHLKGRVRMLLEEASDNGNLDAALGSLNLERVR